MKKIILCSIVLGFIYAFSATEANAQEGCKSFLGRAKERMCETQSGYDACVDLVKKGQIDVCVLSGKQDSWVRRPPNFDPESDLIKRGCKKLSGNVYQCEEKAMTYCKGYLNYYKINPSFTPGAPNIQLVAGCQLSTVLPNNPIPSDLEGGNLYIYVAGQDGALWLAKKNFGKWMAVKSLGGNGIIGLDACSPNPGKTVVMLRGKGNVVGAAVFDNSGNKSGWFNYNSLIGSDPGTACQSGDKVNLFVRGHNNNQLYANFAENGVWANMFQVTNGIGLAIEDVAAKAGQKPKSLSWYDYLPGGKAYTGEKFTTSDTMLGVSGLGGLMKGNPDGVGFGTNDKAVFVRGNDDNVWWRVSRNGQPWEQWASLGGMKITSDPTAISRKAGEILLFARGEDNKLYVRQYWNGSWTVWFPWGGNVAGNPDAASWGGDRVDVFYRGADGAIYHMWSDKPAIINEPKIEKVPGVITNADPTAIGATW